MSYDSEFDDVDDLWDEIEREMVEREWRNDARYNSFPISSFGPRRQTNSNLDLTMPRPRQSTPVVVVDLTSGVDGSPNIPRSQRSDTLEGSGRKRRHSQINLSEEEPVIPQPVTAQQTADDGKERIGKMSCIICMEPYTNMASGPCGHVFCHQCFVRALQASERQQDRGAGSCPSCRKPIYRKRANQVIPVSFMTRRKFDDRAAVSKAKS